MPDSSNNVNSGVRASAVDWSRPIEAVHESGKVVPVTFMEDDKSVCLPMRIRPPVRSDEGGMAECFNRDGSRHGRSGWHIRNINSTPTTPERDPALWDRMEALVRAISETPASVSTVDYGSFHGQARAIVADLPKPVDPDLIEARECVAKVYDGAGRNDLAVQTRAGKQDNRLRVQSALLALRRGRELAAPEVSHVG